MGKILPIALKPNLAPKTLGDYGLTFSHSGKEYNENFYDSHDSPMISYDSHDSQMISYNSHDSQMISYDSHDSPMISYDSHDFSNDFCMISCQRDR